MKIRNTDGLKLLNAWSKCCFCFCSFTISQDWKSSLTVQWKRDMSADNCLEWCSSSVTKILISCDTQKNLLIFQINANNLKWWIIGPYQNSITVKHGRSADWKLWIISLTEFVVFLIRRPSEEKRIRCRRYSITAVIFTVRGCVGICFQTKMCPCMRIQTPEDVHKDLWMCTESSYKTRLPS